jgi:hypothetical protein
MPPLLTFEIWDGRRSFVLCVRLSCYIRRKARNVVPERRPLRASSALNSIICLCFFTTAVGYPLAGRQYFCVECLLNVAETRWIAENTIRNQQDIPISLSCNETSVADIYIQNSVLKYMTDSLYYRVLIIFFFSFLSEFFRLNEHSMNSASFDVKWLGLYATNSEWLHVIFRSVQNLNIT